MTRNARAFTVIEFLIVTVIVSILALIIIPNIMAGQVRAKVSRTMADLRSISVAVDSYQFDYGEYPPGPMGPGTADLLASMAMLSTPIAYLTSTHILYDPFQSDPNIVPRANDPVAIHEKFSFLRYDRMPEDADQVDYSPEAHGYVLRGRGPDRKLEGRPGNAEDLAELLGPAGLSYDPTNGIASRGDIVRTKQGHI